RGGRGRERPECAQPPPAGVGRGLVVVGGGRVGMTEACDRHLARAWLLDRLSGHLDPVRTRIDEVLALDDLELIDAVRGDAAARLRAALDGFDAGPARAAADRAGVEAICQCDPAFPAALRALPSAPGVLYVAGGLERCLGRLCDEPVAVVGARRASQYGLEV